MTATAVRPTLTAALADSEEAARRIRAALTHVGVAAADATTLSLSAHAEQVWTEQQGSRVTGFRAEHELAVTLREQSLAEHPPRLDSLKARLAEAERDATRGEITAPFDARIGKVEAAAGDQLQPNQAILTLYPLDGLYLRAKVPGERSEELRAALTNGERLTARGRYGGRVVTAVLERLAGEADARGVDALLRLDAGTDIPLGAFMELLLERPPAAATLVLPFAALHGGGRIFAVSEGRLTAVEVERVGELIGEGGSQVVVRAPGLATGARVMVTHLPNAVDGLKVEKIE
jgi:multidrug efflux pump subunit AcrA (membrane-fusion protein)